MNISQDELHYQTISNILRMENEKQVFSIRDCVNFKLATFSPGTSLNSGKVFVPVEESLRRKNQQSVENSVLNDKERRNGKGIYPDEFIKNQPVSRQLNFKILNVILLSGTRLTLQQIAERLFKVYEVSPKRQDISNHLQQLKKEKKINNDANGWIITAD